jgi:hypothetical protein
MQSKVKSVPVHGMNVYKTAELQLHSLLISALYEVAGQLRAPSRDPPIRTEQKAGWNTN